MVAIVPAQIRGARAMLGWSRVELAVAARLSVASVKRLEDGASEDALGPARAALELEGVVFLPDEGGGPGMRLRSPAAGAR